MAFSCLIGEPVLVTLGREQCMSEPVPPKPAALECTPDWKRSERVLWAIAEGTATATGEEFFRLLARYAAQAIGARYAFVAETLNPNESQSLAYWEGADFGAGFSYRFPGTPCQRVAQGYICSTSSGLWEKYSEDEWLKQIGAESYIGVPMKNARGQTLGHIAVLHTEPMEVSEEDIAVLKIFAARGCSELERMRAFQELRQRIQDNEDRLRDLFEEAPIAYVHEGLDSKFIRANRAAMRILGIKPEEVAGTYGKSLVPDTIEAQRRLKQAFEAMGRGTDKEGIVLELRRKDNGQPIWIQWWSQPAPDRSYTRTMFIDITDRVLMEREKARLEAQNTYLQEEIRSEHNFDEIVGSSPVLTEVLRLVDQIARIDSTVLILGETGTGKELVARAIHDRSARKHRALVKVNCGAISAGLVESELFGHVKGAFTGAISSRDGRFKLADGGTIFLDEVGELPLDTQVKLLRVLQEQEFEPIGGSRTIRVNVRVVAATNRDLEQQVRDGKFRADLFYRLNVVPLRIPALRERMGDLPLLVTFFVQKCARKFGKQIKSVSEDAMRQLATYAWPGNVRELQNVIERAVILSPGRTLVLAETLRAPNLSPGTSQPEAAQPQPRNDESRVLSVGATRDDGSLEEVERRHIEAVLTRANWMIEGERGAAKMLNLNPSTLRSRMQKLKIKRPAKTSI
jgi:formate hydrogenlyase transcriptional activator